MQQAGITPAIPPRSGPGQPAGGGDRRACHGHPTARRQDGHRQDLRADGLLRRRPAQRPEVPGRLGGHGVHLIAQSAIQPIQTVKVQYLGSNNPRLHSDEVLIALAASANLDPRRPGAGGPGPSSGLSGPLLRHPIPRRRGDLPQAGHPAHLRAQVSDQQALSPISAKRRPPGEGSPRGACPFLRKRMEQTICQRPSLYAQTSGLSRLL